MPSLKGAAQNASALSEPAQSLKGRSQFENLLQENTKGKSTEDDGLTIQRSSCRCVCVVIVEGEDRKSSCCATQIKWAHRQADLMKFVFDQVKYDVG